MKAAYRPAAAADVSFLTAMLAEAAAWQPGATASVTRTLANPLFAHYVAGWPRDADCGVIALDGSDRVGAAWYRHFTPADSGFGFVGVDVPELSIGVVRKHRGQGIGRGLLHELMRAAGRNGCTAISLSVEPDNPAVHLYESMGFDRLDRRGGAVTMIAVTQSAP